MKKKLNLKKPVKLLGNIVVIAALAFVVKKFADMDINPEDFASGEVIASLLL